MLQIALIITIISCVFAGSLYGEESKKLFDGGDMKTTSLNDYMNIFADNMQFCDKGGSINKEEFKKSIQDRFDVNGKRMSPYFDFKVSSYNEYSHDAIEKIEVEFAVKESACTV